MLTATLLLTAAMIGGTSDVADARARSLSRARAALAISAASEVSPAKPPPAKPLTYHQAQQQAIANDMDLMVYVGIKRSKNDKIYGNTVYVEVASLPGYPARCIVLARPKNGILYWLQTEDEYGRPLALYVPLKEVEPSAVPFPAPRQSSSLEVLPLPRVVRPDGEKGAGLRFNSSHNCQSCGTLQLRTSGRGPVAGSHVHTCNRCGTSWWH